MLLKFGLLCCVATVAWAASIPLNDDANTETDYIVGGSKTNITEVPYIVSMQNPKGFHFCGGSIVSRNTIVTAAHCSINKAPSALMFRVGSELKSQKGHLIAAKKITIHPKFDPINLDYDVAVITLAKPLNFTNKIKPIELAVEEPDTESGLVRASGWGHLRENGAVTEHLQSVFVSMVDRKICAKNLKSYVPVTNRMICAADKGKDSCQGDSGGPLVLDDHLVGIVSFGVGCARDKLPGVYTNIAHPEIRIFINKHIE